MRLLLDTHALLWLLGDDRRLGTRARSVITDRANDVLVSIASLWEVAIKVRLGRLDADPAEVRRSMSATGLDLLEIKPSHLTALTALPRVADHRDPFDHLLMAQAVAEQLVFVSEDSHVKRYPVPSMTCSDRRSASP